MQSEDEKSPCHDSNTTTEKKDRPAAIGHNLLLNHKVTSSKARGRYSNVILTQQQKFYPSLHANLHAVQNSINLGTTNQRLVSSVEHTHSHTMLTTIRRLTSRLGALSMPERYYTIKCVDEKQ